jgi:hypothetical protein
MHLLNTDWISHILGRWADGKSSHEAIHTALQPLGRPEPCPLWLLDGPRLGFGQWQIRHKLGLTARSGCHCVLQAE